MSYPPFFSSVTVPKAIDRDLQLFIGAEMPLALLVIAARVQTTATVRISLSAMMADPPPLLHSLAGPSSAYPVRPWALASCFMKNSMPSNKAGVGQSLHHHPWLMSQMCSRSIVEFGEGGCV